MDYNDYKTIVTTFSLKDINNYVRKKRIWKGNYNFALALYERFLELIASDKNISVYRTQGEWWEDLCTFLFYDTFANSNEEELDHTSCDNNDEIDNDNFEEDDDNERWYLADQEGGAEEEGAEEEGPVNIDYHLDISEEYQIHSKKMKTTGTQFKLQFKNLDCVSDIVELAKAAFQRLLDQAFQQGDPTDMVGIEIRHPGLRRHITILFMPQKQWNVEKLIRTIEKVLQSNEEFSLDERITVLITRIKAPAGKGTGRKAYRGNFKQWMEEKSGPHGGCFIHVQNDDELCMARAIVIAIARAEKDTSNQKKKEWERIRKGDHHRDWLQRNRARELMNDAGLATHQGSCSISELSKIQAVLPDYQIKLWSKESMNSKVFEGPAVNPSKILHLYHYNNHFCVISSMAAFFGRAYWCETCEKGYKERQGHKCEANCRCCLKKDAPCKFVKWVYCEECSRVFVSQECYDNHKRDERENGSKKQKITSVCQLMQKCLQCAKTIYKGKPHSCGQTYCNTCKDFADSNHQCYIKQAVESDKDKEKDPSFIFFDFETTQDTEVGESDYGKIFQHKVNCCISLKTCSKCIHGDMEEPAPCSQCGDNRLRIFSDQGCLTEFCEYLFTRENAGCTAIAHNAKGFDAQFILKYLHDQAVVPQLMHRGLKIIELQACGIRIIDSLNFLPMALSAIPKAFGLKVAKGYFPHNFNTAENWNYEGELPDAYFYGPGDMKVEARKEFYEWHISEKKEREKSGVLFNLQKELPKYCKTDVIVLAQGCMKFRDDFITATGVDPLKSCTTIASACNLVFRRNFVIPETIGIVPDKGYRRHERQSVKAIKYLKWYAHVNDLSAKGQYIQHARNQGEFSIGKYKVDGLLRTIEGENLKKIKEFNGCAYHGCKSCFKDSYKTLPSGLQAGEALERTVQRRLYLESQGYEVEEIWECQYDKMLQQNPEMKDFCNSVDIQEPMDAREAFYGGRTNATRLYYKIKRGEKLSFIDICSLYPWVCKRGEFPVGHPTIITDNFLPVTKESRPYKGLIKCTVKPPRGLLHPVLPMRSHNKLCFPLCHTCTEEGNSETCQHSDKERSFTGAWCTLELYKALELGYEVSEIFEVWHYDKWAKYDGTDPKSGLFTEYINTFLKIKQEASGWPSWAKTDEEKEKYIRDYYEVEGIKLDPEKVQVNKGLRHLAKLCLNSFWGKFGQRNNMSKTTYFDDLTPYFETVCDPSNEIAAVKILGENLVSVTHQKADEFSEALPHTSPVIAAYTTTQARLKLLSYIEKLEDRVCYFDTDSVIYLTKSSDTYEPPTGDFLGDMTDELKDYGQGSYISEFISGGPKQYAMRIWSTNEQKFKEVVKIRGFTINSTTANKLNFQQLKKLVKLFIESGAKEELNVVIQKIERTPEREIVTSTMKKTNKVVYDKRVVLSDGNTLPFGY